MTLQGFFNKGVHFIARQKNTSHVIHFFLHFLWQPNQRGGNNANAKRFFSSMGNPISDERFFSKLEPRWVNAGRTSFVLLKNALRCGRDIGQTSKQGRLNSRHGHRREEARKRIFYTTSLLSVRSSVRRPTIPDFSSLSCTAYGSLFVFLSTSSTSPMQNGLLERGNYVPLSTPHTFNVRT